MTLTNFLLARIDEDEQRLIIHRAGCRWVESDTFSECDCGGPARVLAECEAKRQIVELHQASTPDAPDYWCQTCGDVAVPCPTLQLLALPYADHPDYREEWRP